MKDIFTAGELAKLMGVSSRTIRYYDKQGILKPVSYSEGGYRLYDESSVLELQRIKMLQYAGLSLEEIGAMLENQGQESLSDVLWRQKLLLVQRRNQMNRVIASLNEALSVCKEDDKEGEHMKNVIEILRITNMEAAFDNRFGIYEKYSKHQKEWHPWVFEQIALFAGARVLDMGCGHGLVWINNWTRIPQDTVITVIDKLNTGIDFLEQFYLENKQFLQAGVSFVFLRQDLEEMNLAQCYDRIVANHLWDFIKDKETLMEKARGALKSGGYMISTISAYGLLEQTDKLMKELSLRVDFSDAIEHRKSAREEIVSLLQKKFHSVDEQTFINELVIDSPKILLEYIGNRSGEKVADSMKQEKNLDRILENYVKENGNLEIMTYSPLYTCR